MGEKKKILSLDDIKKELGKKKKTDEKKNYLKEFIDDEDYKNIRNDLLKDLAPIIVKDPVKKYNLIYDSLSEGLEPIYFWVVDFMRDSKPAGMGLDVWKGYEDFDMSLSSGFHSEFGQKATVMQQKAMEYFGAINQVIKSILNLIYDLREFEIRLEPYNKLKDEKASKDDKRDAMLSIKGIWMDQVDMKKGRGSINSLAQDLQFVTLRDAFFYVNTPDDVTKLDLNGRVKNILGRKLEEFNNWLKHSEVEIRKRYDIERRYLKAQEGTLRLYASWVKPYLIAAQKLKMRSTTPNSLKNPNIVNAFSNMELEMKVYGKKEVKPGDVHESYKDVELKKKYYFVLEVVMKFRSVPSAVSGQGGRHYLHGGRTDLTFNAYAMDNIDLEAVEAVELYEDLKLVDEWVGGTLKDLSDDIQKYITPPKEEKKSEDKPKKRERMKIENPFGDVIEGFKDVYLPLKEAIIGGDSENKSIGIVSKDMDIITKEKATESAYILYNLYKKNHGMLST